MKHLIIISSIAFGFTFQASAQVPASSYVVGGSSSLFLSTNPDDGKLSSASFSISPEVGKFVSEKWLIGGSLGYSLNHNRNVNFIWNSTRLEQSVKGNFSATRFYSLADKLYFTLGYSLGLSYSLFDSEISDNTITVVENSTSAITPSIGVSPGLAYFINDKWMIYSRMGSLGYNYAHNLDSKTGSHNFGYSLQANSFAIGARFIIGAKK